MLNLWYLFSHSHHYYYYHFPSQQQQQPPPPKQQLFSTEIVIFHEFVANVPYIHHNHLIAHRHTPHAHLLIHLIHTLPEKLSSLKNNTKSNCFSLSLSTFLRHCLFSFLHMKVYPHFDFVCFRVHSSALFSGIANIMDMWIVLRLRFIRRRALLLILLLL